jgi:hypothetical protein
VFGVVSSGGLVLSVESLVCTDGDFVLRPTSGSGNVLQGTCRVAPCAFQMIKR